MNHALDATDMANGVDIHKQISYREPVVGAQYESSTTLITLGISVSGARADSAAALQPNCSPDNTRNVDLLIKRCSKLDD